MKVLVHYTTKEKVFKCFSRVGTFNFDKVNRIKEICDFYKKYNRAQEVLFFVVCYCDVVANVRKYTACKISFNNETSKYLYTLISEDMCEIICKELGLNNSNTYDKDVYYKIYTIEDAETRFMNNKTKNDLNKLRLKYYSWDELLSSNKILFNEISNIIFNRENVMKVASTYKPSIKYTSQQLQKKYLDALISIGFISKEGIDVNFTTLHGDIGEFIMHIMLSEFLNEQCIEKYIYPKLVFKTSPKMPVYGNDGTIYVKDKKEIYYLEAKFYSDLNIAINKAVSSLKDHNEVSQEKLNHKIELFRNIRTDELDEIIEIDEDVSENLVIFVMCDSQTKYNDILKKVQQNKNLNTLKKSYSILLFVLPVLNKKDFLNYFKNLSEKVWEDSHEK